MVAQPTVPAQPARTRVQAAATLGVDSQAVHRLVELDRLAADTGFELRFGGERTEFAFDRAEAELSPIGTNRTPADLFETQVRVRLARRDRTASHASWVRPSIAQRMDGEATRVREIAGALAPSARNHQLERMGEGTSFRQLLDERRREAATLMLENGCASLTEIVYPLGFSRRQIVLAPRPTLDRQDVDGLPPHRRLVNHVGRDRRGP